MPIIGLSEVRRLPRLGKIHLGVKEINAKGIEYPKAVDYFVVPPEVAEVYGEKPTELDIVIPTEDPNIFFPQFYKQYSNKRGLVCKGDGATANRVEEKEGELIELTCNPDTCEFYLKDKCKPVGNLLFVLPEVKGFGVYQIDTSSIHNIINLNSEIALLKNLLGRISGIPLKLTREVQKLQQKGEIRNIALIHIRSPYSLTELQNNKKVLGKPEPVSIEVPDNDVPESVPDEILPDSAILEEEKTTVTETEAKAKNKLEEDKLIAHIENDKLVIDSNPNPESIPEPIVKEPEKESAGPIRKIATVKPSDSKELIKEIYKLLTSRRHTTIQGVITLLEKALPKYSWKKIDNKVFQRMSVENLQKVLDFLNEEDAVYLTPTE